MADPWQCVVVHDGDLLHGVPPLRFVSKRDACESVYVVLGTSDVTSLSFLSAQPSDFDGLLIYLLFYRLTRSNDTCNFRCEVEEEMRLEQSIPTSSVPSS